MLCRKLRAKTNIRDGKFREDLYYRLNVFPLVVPPLRDRVGDVPLLVQFLVGKFGARVGRRIETIEQSTMQSLISYHWPGNVRELENVLERAIILSNGPMLEIDPEMFNTAPKDSMPSNEAISPSGIRGHAESLESIERNHILTVLRKTDWVVEGPRGAALILDLHPNTLRSRMKKLGVQRGSA